MANHYEESTAIISDCKKYRYLLRRVWDTVRPRVLFVMLNPSTADALEDDATIRSCVRLSKDNNFGAIEVVNLFGYQTTDPKFLLEVDDPVGPDNDRILEAAVNRTDLPIVAWGAHEMAKARGRIVHQLIKHQRPATFCFGATKDKQPKHPLYIKSGTPLVTYG